MKMNIKGLVFVGFAAAVFASAANAADGDNKKVTSYQYTENTYEKKANKVEEITDANKNSTTLYPSNKALTDALAEVGGTVGTGTITVTQNGATVGSFSANADEPVTVPVAAADWNATTGQAGEILNKPTIPTVNDGTLSIKVGDNAAQTFTANTAGNTNVNLGSAAGLGTATTIASTSTDSDAATAKAVYDYVGTLDTDAYTGTGLIDVTNHVITTTAQQNVIETVKVNGTALTPDSNKAVDITVPAAGDGQLSIQVGNNAAQTFTANQATGTNTTVTLGSAAGLGTATTISSSSTNNDAATALAVYNFLNNGAGTANCSDTNPCAFVLGSGAPEWKPIQQ